MELARSAFFLATLPKSLEWTCSQTMWTSSPQRKGRSAWINFMAFTKMITWMMAKLACSGVWSWCGESGSGLENWQLDPGAAFQVQTEELNWALQIFLELHHHCNLRYISIIRTNACAFDGGPGQGGLRILHPSLATMNHNCLVIVLTITFMFNEQIPTPAFPPSKNYQGGHVSNIQMKCYGRNQNFWRRCILATFFSMEGVNSSF